jgi:hypothetical protein
MDFDILRAKRNAAKYIYLIINCYILRNYSCFLARATYKTTRIDIQILRFIRIIQLPAHNKDYNFS